MQLRLSSPRSGLNLEDSVWHGDCAVRGHSWSDTGERFGGMCSGWKARATEGECSGRLAVDEGQGGRFSGGFAWRGCTEYSV